MLGAQQCRLSRSRLPLSLLSVTASPQQPAFSHTPTRAHMSARLGCLFTAHTAATWEIPQIAIWVWRKHVLMWGRSHGTGANSVRFQRRKNMVDSGCGCPRFVLIPSMTNQNGPFGNYVPGVRCLSVVGCAHFSSLKSHLVAITTSSNLVDLSRGGRVTFQWPLWTIAHNRAKCPAGLHPQQETTSIQQASRPRRSGCPGWFRWSD